MSVGILLITHNCIGQELLSTARDTLGFCPVQTACLNVLRDADTDTLRERASRMADELDTGDGILVLTDAYGSTPSNIASNLEARGRYSVVAGINLPMLLRVFNYPRLSLVELEEKALTGGQDGIILVEKHGE